MGTIKDYKELEIWKKGIEIVREVYRMTDKFPDKELYGLTSQMRRSAISIPSNIAEGFRRQSSKEFKQFLNIALGSLAELETQLIIAKELSYLKEADSDKTLENIDHSIRMVVTLSRKL
jgi:four helix bundle protein